MLLFVKYNIACFVRNFCYVKAVTFVTNKRLSKLTCVTFHKGQFLTGVHVRRSFAVRMLIAQIKMVRLLRVGITDSTIFQVPIVLLLYRCGTQCGPANYTRGKYNCFKNLNILSDILFQLTFLQSFLIYDTHTQNLKLHDTKINNMKI